MFPFPGRFAPALILHPVPGSLLSCYVFLLFWETHLATNSISRPRERQLILTRLSYPRPSSEPSSFVTVPRQHRRRSSPFLDVITVARSSSSRRRDVPLKLEYNVSPVTDAQFRSANEVRVGYWVTLFPPSRPLASWEKSLAEGA